MLNGFEGPTPLPPENPQEISVLESPSVFPFTFLSFFILAQLSCSEFLFLVTKQFITKTNGQNLSHLKNNRAIKKDQFSNGSRWLSSFAVCVVYRSAFSSICVFQETLQVLIKRIWFPTSITNFS